MRAPLLAALTVACLATSAALAAPKKAPAPVQAGAALGSDTAIATIDGRPITYSEIEGAVGAPVHQAAAEYLNKAYDLQRRALDQLIMKRLLDQEAAQTGKSADEWMRQVFLPSVPEPAAEEVRRAFEAQGLPAADLERVAPGLREQLRREAGQRRFAQLLQALMASHRVKTLLVAPEPVRSPVAAVGPARGAPGAKVTIVEFSDFQCPYCSRVNPALEQVLQAYEGKVRLFYRQLPLPFHAHARKAAEASLCADDQGRFRALHDRMFADQGRLGVAELKAAARELGLDGERFDACLDGGAKSAAVEADIGAAKELGVQGTPAFFINGVFLSGAVPFEQLKAAIDRELEAG